MVSEQNVTQTITQAGIEASKAAIMTMTEAETPLGNARTAQLQLSVSGPI